MELYSGNEAIARGAYEGGVSFAAGYPGTPSTEILENLSDYKEVNSQWSPNEKVALEVGMGASLGGARTLVTMKHVGLNVAADPLFTAAYTGVNAGLVILVADDPSMHSSQNEQDSRYYARSSLIPMLEPSDSQEAKEYLKEALKLSEDFDTPVLLRMTTRISHSKTKVELSDRTKIPIRTYEKDIAKYVMLPQNARQKRLNLLERMRRLEDFVNTYHLNQVEEAGGEIGIITSGITYQHAKEVFKAASFLKLGMVYPLPFGLIESFVKGKKSVYVVEELEPFLEDAIKAHGIKVLGKELVPRVGELSPDILRDSFSLPKGDSTSAIETPLPPRPPLMCPGCPHRGVFHSLNKLKLTVMGDIGCYTLGALAPFEAMDTCLAMGAGVGMALGFEKATSANLGKAVAVIGDSTFVHSGITPLIDIVYNKGASTVIILDNRITAMTGRQDHPGTGRTLMGEETRALDFMKLAEAIGVGSIRTIDPYDLKQTLTTIKEETEKDEPSVIITTRPCALILSEKETPFSIDKKSCTRCLSCLKVGCPAISFDKAKGLSIDANVCIGCGVCAKVCKFSAILEVDS